mmetsp:Transcript_55859/g.102400  ORF Transcript_55859/g.102400 Transcript_55859/m.102400 type:complete len:1124 (-) Transcript_55859:82-3453(-)
MADNENVAVEEEDVVVEEGAEDALADEEGEAGDEELLEEEEAEAEGEAGDAEADAAAKEEEERQNAARNAGSDINTEAFDELRLESAMCQAANDAWRLFINTADSREAAGEAIYAALFEGAPSLQSLFTTPRAVQAMKFMNGLASFVNALDDPAKLKILVETLAFGHLHLDVTVPRVMIFRDAILDLFKVELVEKFSPSAREGWKKLLNYVGGALIYVKVNYATRINCLLKSWKEANHGDTDKKDELAGAQSSSAAEEEQQKKQQELMQKKKKRTTIQMLMGKKASGENEGGQTTTTGEKNEKGDENRVGSQSVPTTYPEMFLFNSAVMGFGTSTWMAEVLACFNNIVTNVANSARLQEECDVLALRIARVAKGNINLAEYKSCMLASLRSLLPKSWDSAHEVAWTWLWENVERLVLRIHGQPPVWEKALGKILGSFDEESKFELRKEIYARFFNLAPAGQDFFKQSGTYLDFIAERIMTMVTDLYDNPVKMVDDISALGLRHVGYSIPTELFGPFVTACIEVVGTYTPNELAVTAFRWSLGLIAKMLVRTITEGSTIVMKAVDANSAKQLKKAISCAPRGERAKWLLVVQVGTQSISPLGWAIENGCLEAARAIIEDLLTIRADRESYYYGVDDLFMQHPDIIKILSESAPTLLPVLLDHLIWRCRTAVNGMRRTNYYVKHLLVDQDGKPSSTLQWLVMSGNPTIMAHPVIVLVSDTLWNRIVKKRFILQKIWFVMSLLVFLLSQAILPKLERAGDADIRWTILTCRGISYGPCVIRLSFIHGYRFVKSYRARDTVKLLWYIPVPAYLKDQYDLASCILLVLLFLMCSNEPMLWCIQSGDFPTEVCAEAEDVQFRYSIFSMVAMAIQWFLIVDMAVFSTQLSAFMLVVTHVLSEIGRFMVALIFLLLTFGSAISVLDHNQEEMSSLPSAAMALFAITVKLYQDDYRGIDDPALIVAIFVYQTASSILLLNLLIAQLQCSYEYVLQDMIGFARLNRSSVIAETMTTCSREQWEKFVQGLNFDERLEFNEGDVGISGGIQDYEPSHLHPIVSDSIYRFGGSCSPLMQWPTDNSSEEEENKFDRMERLIQKAVKRMMAFGDKQDGPGAGGSAEDKNSSDSEAEEG